MSSLHITPQHTESADGTDIAWYDFGGNGPDLVLAHATSLCALAWAPVVDALQSDFRCIGYDMRGHGLSGRPALAEGWAWERYGDDVSAVIDASGVLAPFGVGHSCGGASEILLEEAAPGTFRALAVFEPVIFPVDPPAGPSPDRDLAVRARKRRDSFVSRQAVFDAFTAKGPFVALHPDALRGYVEYGFVPSDDGVTLRCRRDDEAQVYVMASAHSAYSNLANVRCHTTLMRGSDSVAFAEADMTPIVDRLPDAEFVELPGAGHFGALEQPDVFADLVKKSFLNS